MFALTITTREREEIINITREIESACAELQLKEGGLLVFCPHTTCGLTINESADPDVRADLMRFFREIAPRDHGWRHMEGNADAHIRSSLLGVSLMIPVSGGKLRLGTWQTVYLYEGDGPRQRKVWLQPLSA